MSLEQHSIDQGYRAHLDKLEVAPPIHAWAAIAAQLPNEKADEKGIWFWGSSAASAKTPEEKSTRERVIFWWWTGALIALATVSLLAYYGLNSTKTNNSPNPAPNTSPAAIVPIASLDADDSEELTSIEAREEDCPEVMASTTEPEKSSLSYASTRQTQVFSPQAPHNEKHATLASPTSYIAVLDAEETPQSTLTNAPLLTDTKVALTPPSATPVGLSMASAVLNELPFNDLLSLDTEAPNLPFGPDVGCPTFNNPTDWSFAVRLFGGPGTIFQEYTSTAQTESYAVLRDSVEAKQLSVHGGLRFEATTGAGLFLRAGADYMMYRSNVTSLGPPRILTVIDSIFVEDTQTWRVETSSITTQSQRKVYNRQHAVVLTGGVGFRKTFGNVSPYIMAEAGFEILFKRKGDFILPDGNYVDLAEDDQGLYINDRPGLQYGGVLGVDFAVTDRIEVGVSGHYKQLGGLRGSADLLDFDQSTAFGALNLRYTIR